MKRAAEKAAEEKFSQLYLHVLKDVQVTGRSYGETNREEINEKSSSND